MTKKFFYLISTISFVIFFALSFTLYQITGASSIKSLVEQMLHREQVIVRSGASSISSFIDLTSRSLLILSSNNIITPKILQDFVDNWSDTPVAGIILTDIQGQIKLTASNAEKLSLGGNVSDRDYFIAASGSPPGTISFGKPFVSRVPGAGQTFKIPVATPLYSNNKFIGVLTVSISIPSLTEKYLEPLKISPRTGIYLFNSNGDVFNGTTQEVVNQNIFHIVDEHPFLGDKIVMPLIRQKLTSNQESKLDIVIPDFSTGKLTRTLIASSPVKLNSSTKWILAITTPIDDALIFISPFVLRNVILLIFTYFSSIALSLFIYNRFLQKR